MARVAVIGHVEWVEFVSLKAMPQRGTVSHAERIFARAAGGGGVAAAVMADNGAEVEFFCALGEDERGKAAVSQLLRRGVGLEVAWRTQPTRRAVTLLEIGGERTIVTYGERLEPRGADELNWSWLSTVDGVYFTAGDTPALRRAREGRVLVASPRGREALEADDVAVDALVFSATDEDECRWANRFADRARLLVATNGAHGGRWWGEEEGSWGAVPPPDEPRDSYGAGDSFAAGFTVGLAKGGSVAEAAELGAQCGARCLTWVGAP